MTRLMPLLVATVALIASALTGYSIAQHDAQTADVTVMPCSAWDNGAHPVIPPYTLTDACVDPSGTLHTAPDALEATR